MSLQLEEDVYVRWLFGMQLKHILWIQNSVPAIGRSCRIQTRVVSSLALLITNAVMYPERRGVVLLLYMSNITKILEARFTWIIITTNFIPCRETLLIMSTAMHPPPPGGNYNKAGEVYAFTWILAIISVVFVLGRMYSRVKLTRNVWWDDWLICFALVCPAHDEDTTSAGLTNIGPRLYHLNHVERVCGQGLRTTSLLPKAPSNHKRAGDQHNLTIPIHGQYCRRQDLRRLFDREDFTTGRLAEMDAPRDLHQYRGLRHHHFHALLRAVPASKSDLGQGDDQEGYRQMLESHSREHMEFGDCK